MRTNPAWNPTRFAGRVGLTAATPYRHAGDRGHHPAHGGVRSDPIRARLPKLACCDGADHHGEYHGDGAAGRCRRAADSVRRACRGRHRDVVRRRHRPGRLQAAGEPRSAHRTGALTGESMPVRKDAAALLAAGDRDTALTDAACLAFMGTTVISGSALAVVIATVRSTLFGGLSRAFQWQRPPLPVARMAGAHGPLRPGAADGCQRPLPGRRRRGWGSSDA